MEYWVLNTDDDLISISNFCKHHNIRHHCPKPNVLSEAQAEYSLRAGGQDSSPPPADLRYSTLFRCILVWHSRLSLTPGDGINDWPSFRPVGPTARREDQDFYAGPIAGFTELKKGI